MKDQSAEARRDPRTIALNALLREVLEESRKADPTHGGDIVLVEARRDGFVFLKAHNIVLAVTGL